MIDTVGFKQKQNENSKTNGNRKQQLLDFDYVNCGTEDLFKKFKTSLKGLSDKEVKLRLEEYGYNEPAKKKKRTILFQIASKFINPLVIVLLIIAGFSLFFGERMSALLIILMAMMSVFLSFLQEHQIMFHLLL